MFLIKIHIIVCNRSCAVRHARDCGGSITTYRTQKCHWIRHKVHHARAETENNVRTGIHIIRPVMVSTRPSVCSLSFPFRQIYTVQALHENAFHTSTLGAVGKLLTRLLRATLAQCFRGKGFNGAARSISIHSWWKHLFRWEENKKETKTLSAYIYWSTTHSSFSSFPLRRHSLM